MSEQEYVPVVGENEECPAVGYQSVAVCVPVTVTPYAHTQATVTRCCGEAVITGNTDKCSGQKKGACTFVISQTLCVAVPVVFGAEAQAGDTYVDCLGASGEDCTDCAAVPEVTPEAEV